MVSAIKAKQGLTNYRQFLHGLSKTIFTWFIKNNFYMVFQKLPHICSIYQIKQNGGNLSKIGLFLEVAT